MTAEDEGEDEDGTDESNPGDKEEADEDAEEDAGRSSEPHCRFCGKASRGANGLRAGC